MIKEISGQIEEEIQKIAWPDHLPELYDPIEYTMENGGKRIRPLLLILSGKIFGLPFEQSINQALAVEIFHNFTLVHDDIMDNAPLRRGKPSVYKRWDQNTAILSGDVMYSIAMQYAAKCDADVLPKVIETFLDMTIKVCEGQQMDMNFEERENVSLSDYIKMIELKTAYLLAGSLKIGAILGKAEEKAQNEIFEFGLKVGTAFQLMDDYLDAFGDPEKFGKKVGGDIIAGKKTYLHIETLNALSANDRDNFNKTASSNSIDSALKIDQIKDYFITSGAADKLKEEANNLLDSAKKLLIEVPGDIEAKEELITLTQLLINREK